MAIAHLTEDQFTRILKESFTPSAHITTPERLFGREKALRLISRALQSPSRQIFIVGDRGVGKSSLALTVAYLHNSSSHKPIYVVCGESDSFSSVIQNVGRQVIDISSRFEVAGAAPQMGLNAFSFGATYQPGGTPKSDIPLPQTTNDALDVIRYVLSKRPDDLFIVIDEMERLTDPKERTRFAEFIKNLSSLDSRVRFVFCGIATTVSDLIGAHESAGRIFETIELERLHFDALWQIIEAVSSKTGVAIDRDKLVRIGQISNGFPHYVHLIGECLFWHLFDDEGLVSRVSEVHFREAIKGAIQRTEQNLKMQYEKATRKTRNTIDYEEALWALADTNSDKRQVAEIYTASYRPMMMKRGDRDVLPREKLNQRLLALKKPSHGSVIIGYGSGWFGFRENILRGYVRLVAERNGIQLGRAG